MNATPDSLGQLAAAMQANLAAIQRVPDQLIFDGAQAPDPQLIANMLAMQGIAIVRGFVKAPEITALRGAVAPVIAQHLDRVFRDETKEYDDFIVNFELQRFKTFPDLQNCPKPIFNLRNGKNATVRDAGFVDLFKPDTLYPALKPYCDALGQALPMRVAEKFQSLRYKATACNLYINYGVANTRDFHIDADIHQMKAFLYLTDVTTLGDGPYCYFPGSHQEHQIKALNRLYNRTIGKPSTDMSLCDPAGAIACLAPAGTLILSLQSGLHRGYPQKADSKRLMLTQLFEPN